MQPPTALELARRLRAREVTSAELVQASLDRIARLDGELGAFVQVAGAAARAAARRCDRALAAGGAVPPFCGVPIAIKDAALVRGMVTRAGSRGVLLWSPIDDRVVRRLRAAGFVIVGKTAMSELGATPVTETDLHPPTRNPHDPGVTAGGSSGGAGAAVAADLVPIAHGGDGAGSIRIPAALCGLVGHKPSRGCVPPAIGPVDPYALVTAGPLARSVDDAAALLDVLAGTTASGRYAEAARRAPARLRVRLATRTPLGPTEPELVAAVERVGAALAAAGHRVERAAELDVTLDEFLPLWQRAIARAPVLRPGLLRPVTRWLYDAGRRLDDAAVHAVQDRLAARIAAWWGDADVVVTPAVAVRPPAIGAWKGLPPADEFAEAARLGAFTAPFNVTGQPAVSLPVGVGTWGTPLGVQLAGRAQADGTVLALARWLEHALPARCPAVPARWR